jgi:ABC-type Fe3+/spermidine/putrescine transport system ATPase subunit
VRGRKSGERVLVLVRPETLEVAPSGNGGGLGGKVVAHIFLGATTRLKVDARPGTSCPRRSEHQGDGDPRRRSAWARA